MIISFCTCILLSAYVSGQKALSDNDFIPDTLLKDDKVWSIIEKYSPVYYSRTNWLKVGKKRDIDGKNYNVMMMSSDEYRENWWESTLLLREENGKVYQYDLYYDKEFLQYDFSMKVGDSISYFIFENMLVTTTLDSIRETIIDNKIHKIYYLTNREEGWWPVPEIWIEGIGSLFGLNRLTPGYYCTGCNSRSLLCCLQNETLLYHDTQYPACYHFEGYPFKIDTVNSSNSFQVYPNPTDGHFVVEATENNAILGISVFDMVGKQIRLIEGKSEHKVTVNLSNEKKGVYFLLIEFDNGVDFQKILVK